MTSTRVRYGWHELPRLLTRIEQEDSHALAAAVRAEADAGDAGHAVGLTGPPGVGKSTLIGAIIAAARAQGRTVAVLAIDPSSARTGGAVLGDRLRMIGTAPDPGVFIRSMASRGQLGGLSVTAPAATAALVGAGFDLVLVEAVGAGQNEIDVADVVDTTVVLAAPGLGDSVQALKAGLLEVGDVYVVNKADHSGSGQTESQLRAMLRSGPPPDAGAWVPAVVRTVAVRGEGLDDLLGAVDAHRDWLRAATCPRMRRGERLVNVLQGAAVRTVVERLRNEHAGTVARRLADDVASGRRNLAEAAEMLVDRIMADPMPANRGGAARGQ